MREPVVVLKSPSNRIRLEVTGTAQLDQNDIDWLKFLGQKPNYINERLVSKRHDINAGGEHGSSISTSTR